MSARAAQSDAAAARGEAHAAAAAADSVVRAQDAIAHAQEASSRAIDAAAERLDRLEAQVAVSDARGRATGLMVAASGLHRDILSGAPLHDDLAALAGAAPLPASVQQSLDQLARSDGGVPTLRDLGVGFEAVDAAIIARGGGQGSWFTLSGWFGGANADSATRWTGCAPWRPKGVSAKWPTRWSGRNGPIWRSAGRRRSGSARPR